MPTNEAGLSGGHDQGDGGRTTASDMPAENAKAAQQPTGDGASTGGASAGDGASTEAQPDEDKGSGI